MPWYELETLTAPALSDLIDGGVGTVVVPFGSIEHQRGHLPIGADALLADSVGNEVARRLDAVVVPTTRVGCGDAHAELMGTMSLRRETLTDVAVDMCVSLAAHNFRLIVLVSTHGGNAESLSAAIARLQASLDTALVCAPRGDVGPSPGAHSGEWLTSVMLAIHPDLVDLTRASDELAGELRSADAQRGAAHLELFIASIVREVHAATTRH